MSHSWPAWTGRVDGRGQSQSQEKADGRRYCVVLVVIQYKQWKWASSSRASSTTQFYRRCVLFTEYKRKLLTNLCGTDSETTKWGIIKCNWRPYQYAMAWPILWRIWISLKKFLQLLKIMWINKLEAEFRAETHCKKNYCGSGCLSRSIWIGIQNYLDCYPSKVSGYIRIYIQIDPEIF